MREKYRENIAYLFKKVMIDNTLEWEEEGTAFWCNRESKKTYSSDPMTGVKIISDDEIVKTTTQLDFKPNNRISFTKTPRNDANYNDFSTIQTIDVKPYKEKGNKHRTVLYNEYWITVT